jgi:ERF superfamily
VPGGIAVDGVMVTCASTSSAMTYAKRYSLLGVLGIAPEDDEDDDAGGDIGHDDPPDPQGERHGEEPAPQAGPESDRPAITSSIRAKVDALGLTNAERMELAKKSLGAPTSTLWGQLRLAISVNAASGTAIVGAFGRAAAVYRKAALRVDMTESHADFFQKNLTAIRAEQRELLAVYKPVGFGTASGLLTTPA